MGFSDGKKERLPGHRREAAHALLEETLSQAHPGEEFRGEDVAGPKPTAPLVWVGMRMCDSICVKPSFPV